MGKNKTEILEQPESFLNRELSWLEFNRRVLQQARNPKLPLLERVKFLAIFASNLDEFFMIRVAGLRQQAAAGIRKKDPSGKTPAEQLEEISRRCHQMMEEHARTMRQVFAELRENGLILFRREELTSKQKTALRAYFESEIFPVLTPISLTGLNPPPLLEGLQLFAAIVLEPQEDTEEVSILAVPVPDSFKRFPAIPSSGQTVLIPLEDLILEYAAMLCPNRTIRSTACFRITRDADVPIQEDEAGDLLETMEEAVRERLRRAAVRLQISSNPAPELLEWLRKHLNLKSEDIYETDALLGARSLWEIAERPGYERLKLADWPPQPPADLPEREDLWETLRDRDVLLVHPYESFDPVVRLLKEAAEDPQVLAIKQTLYRTSGDSPIIRALEEAAQNGKEVTVLVELKARFDEERNIQWARRLEDAGCTVIYGVMGLKTHAKALLIVRREEGRIRRYVHLSTGNYNDKTARIYSDIGLMSADSELTRDTASFFNLLTGLSESVGWSKLVIAPTAMRRRLLELIEREIQVSSPDRPGLIMAKLNALEDKQMCQALYRASQAGVKVRLNIRGICCLRPGVKGLSENIEVVSIVDRFLEHARILYFGNGGHPEVYLASADWMGRNLDRRLELLFPIADAGHKKRLIQMLELYLQDNCQSWQLLPDGTYKLKESKGKPVRAQQVLYEQAVEAARRGRRSQSRFRPIKQD
ncbi:MAG TPA: polyphosphate kinase 1 [Anaerohalosphaeraceae bacterium]|nr:polyphosphate kinase 1 [Anaerohalosphaeraceae bacterium]HOL89067.1 polyphosphate kinase 1 [Anaerohalosphaeraceae bacterium]HPP55880.1 polyphosphate kinase 1 [Anaerohalosphaeraceae bacterium]